MRYMCVTCNYIFDESQWDKEENIPAWTKIDDLYWCPVCWDFESFQWIQEEVNYAEDDHQLRLLEIEHIPQIQTISHDSSQRIIEVTIWLSWHPMWEEHRITSILLYDEYWDLIMEEFLWSEREPKVQFDISDLGKYEIVARCSIHWLWGRKFFD